MQKNKGDVLIWLKALELSKFAQAHSAVSQFCAKQQTVNFSVSVNAAAQRSRTRKIGFMRITAMTTVKLGQVMYLCILKTEMLYIVRKSPS